MKTPLAAIAAAAALAAATPAAAGTVDLTLTGSSTGSFAGTARILDAPAGIRGGTVAAVGQETVDGSGALGSFIAWCLDLAANVNLGEETEYRVTDTPFSNSFGLGGGAQDRVMDMFSANYGTLDVTSAVDAAAFQLGLWEVVYDDDFDLGTGEFRARGKGRGRAAIDATAASYLAAADAYAGPVLFDATFLESTGSGADRRQNLVTAAPAGVAAVPVPAAGLLLLGGLGGIVALRRRKGA